MHSPHPPNPFQLLLSPWDCSVDRSGLFPEFVELSAKVQRCFEGGSLEEVVEALKADGSAWAQECLKHMDEASPLRSVVGPCYCACVGLDSRAA